ncbi:Type I restriction-modification system, specificity subunit S [Methanosarcina sp. MTP4]|uniref:restriction endonuclease subunit S n=1 Tax=Methanosarcina sp. MTP4 TaxID=1434100 RepID=UPI00061551A8|nr:restriction endonuclease subunit S [Methanosarcina sp. MTP4]AKB24824.1 Type I restriction-modification system, specificity subunit S [Methanosarcina sp. MTP4]
MDSNWPEVSIDELKASSKNAIAMGPFGSRIKVENFVEDGVPVIKGGNLTGDFIVEDKFDFLTEEKADELKASNAFRRDIVITHRGTIGQVGIIPDDSKFERYVVSQSQLKVTLDQEKVNPYFIYYFLRSPVGQHRLLMNASQVGVPAIAQASTSVKSIMVPYPEKEIQNKVVEIILGLDTKIHKNRQINQTLETMAQAMFKSWFVDFEPVKAKIAAIEAGEDAEGVIRAAMSAISGKTDEELDQLQAEQPEHYTQLKTTAELFPSAMQDSELGKVPDGWEISNFGKVSTCFDKNRIPLSKRQREQKKGLIPYYGATSVMDYVDESIFDDIYLLLGEDGSVLKDDGSPFIQYIWGKSWVNNHAHVLQGANGVSTEHLMLFMQSQNITAYVTGAVQLKLNQKNMNSIPFINAGKPINDAFYFSIAPFYAFKRNDEEEIKGLRNLSDILLPKLLSGELEVNAINEAEG